MTKSMPDPWFRATSCGCTIRAGLMPYEGNGRTEGVRQLAGFRMPDFQRDRVWTREQSTALVQSLWDGMPIGSYVVNIWDNIAKDIAGMEADYWLLDGQQRWSAIVEYLADGFPVRDASGGEAYFSELDGQTKRRFMGLQFPRIETRNYTREQCLEVYERLAYGGTAHEPRSEPAPPPQR